jgi:L-2,4-diaminobutyrate decarboxylase
MWLTLRVMGPAALGDAFDTLIDLTQAAHQLLTAHPAIEVLHAPELTTQIFRYIPGKHASDAQIDEINAAIRKALFRSGNAVIAGTKVDGRQYLKFTLLNPTTTIADLEDVLSLIAHYGREQVRASALSAANQGAI